MKWNITALWAVALTLAALSTFSCSRGPDPAAQYVGNWVAEQGDLQGGSQDNDWMLDFMMGVIAKEIDATARAELTLAADGTYALAMDLGAWGDSSRSHGTGTWTVNENTVTLRSDHSDETFVFQYRGDKLTLQDQPGLTAVFSRS